MKNKYIFSVLFLFIINYYFGKVEIVSIDKQNHEPNLDIERISNLKTDTSAIINIELINDKITSDIKKSNQLRLNSNITSRKKILNDTADYKNIDANQNTRFTDPVFTEPAEKPVISGILYNKNLKLYTAILIYKNNAHIVKESMKIDIFKIEKIENDKVIVSVDNNLITLTKK